MIPNTKNPGARHQKGVDVAVYKLHLSEAINERMKRYEQIILNLEIGIVSHHMRKIPNLARNYQVSLKSLVVLKLGKNGNDKIYGQNCQK